MKQYILKAILPVLFVLGCRSENELIKVEEPNTIDVSVEEKPQIDVLLVLDNSCSMQEDWAYVTYGITQIPVELNYHNFDWKLGITSMDSSDGILAEIDSTHPDSGWEMISMLDSFRLRAGQLEEGFLSAITVKIANPDWFRQGVKTVIFFITDEKEQSNLTAADFHSMWGDPHITASMVGPDQDRNGIVSCAEVARAYHEASDIIFDICAQERWSLIEQIVQ